MASAGEDQEVIVQLLSRDLLHYDKMIRERGTTWEEVISSIDLVPYNRQRLKGVVNPIQIINCSPVWTQLFTAQRKSDLTFCDVHLITEEGYIPVHSVFLRGLSPFLDSLLANVNSVFVSCKYDVVSISLPDIKMAHVKAFLNLLYNGSVCLTEEANEEDVRNVAKLLHIGEMSLECVPLDREDNTKKNKGLRSFKSEIPKDGRYYGKTKSAEPQPVVEKNFRKSPSMPKLDMEETQEPVAGPSSSCWSPKEIPPVLVVQNSNQISTSSVNSGTNEKSEECIPKRKSSRNVKSKPKSLTLKQAMSAFVQLERVDEATIQKFIGSRQKSYENNSATPKEIVEGSSKSGSNSKTKKNDVFKPQEYKKSGTKRKKDDKDDSTSNKAKRPRKLKHAGPETDSNLICVKPTKKEESVKVKKEKCLNSIKPSTTMINIGLKSMKENLANTGSLNEAGSDYPEPPFVQDVSSDSGTIDQIPQPDPVTISREQDVNKNILSMATSPPPFEQNEQIGENNLEHIVPEEQTACTAEQMEQDEGSSKLELLKRLHNDNPTIFKNFRAYMPISTSHPRPPMTDECSAHTKSAFMSGETISDVTSGKTISITSIPTDSNSGGMAPLDLFNLKPPSPTIQVPEEEKAKINETRQTSLVGFDVKELNAQQIPQAQIQQTSSQPQKTNINQLEKFKTETAKATFKIPRLPRNRLSRNRPPSQQSNRNAISPLMHPSIVVPEQPRRQNNNFLSVGPRSPTHYHSRPRPPLRTYLPQRSSLSSFSQSYHSHQLGLPPFVSGGHQTRRPSLLGDAPTPLSPQSINWNVWDPNHSLPHRFLPYLSGHQANTSEETSSSPPTTFIVRR